MEFKSNNKGFSVIEVLAVVVILGILTAVAIPSVTRYITRSRKQAYETMEKSIYDGARNYVLDENKFLNKCSNGYSDIEGADNLLKSYKYIESLTDPTDNSKECEYKVYGCMESDQSMATLATYKYKIQIKCVDYENCAIYRDDGSVSPCEDGTDDTDGPICGEQNPTLVDWTSNDSSLVEIACLPNGSARCDQPTYSKTFTEEGKSGEIEISDIFGNKTTCSVDYKIDRTVPSTPVINNPYENTWTNNSYKITIKSVDNVSGIAYFEYRYPNSNDESERNWTQWENSSKQPGDDSVFTTSAFSKERSEYVEVRACDYAGNCSESVKSMIKIDKTAPSCTIVRSIPTPDGENGWYKSKVTMSINVTNNTSNVVTAVGSPVSYGFTTSTTPIYSNNATSAVQGDTKSTIWRGYVKDETGNVASCADQPIKIDTVAPTFRLLANTSKIYTDSHADSTSGVASGYYLWSNGSTASELSLQKGNFIVSIKDNAGNVASSSIQIYNTSDANCSGCYYGSDNTYSCCVSWSRVCSCNGYCSSSMGCGYSCNGHDCASISWSSVCSSYGTCGSNTCSYGCDKVCNGGTKLNNTYCYKY